MCFLLILKSSVWINAEWTWFSHFKAVSIDINCGFNCKNVGIIGNFFPKLLQMLFKSYLADKNTINDVWFNSVFIDTYLLYNGSTYVLFLAWFAGRLTCQTINASFCGIICLYYLFSFSWFFVFYKLRNCKLTSLK